MIRYILRRLLLAVLTLFVLSVVCYGLFYAIPTDPAAVSCSKQCTPQNLAGARHKLELDIPIQCQYLRFVKGLVTERHYANMTGPKDFIGCPSVGAATPESYNCAAPCLGYSFARDTGVNDLIGPKLPVTVSLTLYAAILWILMGVGAGIVSALKPRSLMDRVVMVLALAGVSLPTFFTGLTIQKFVVDQGYWPIRPDYFSPFSQPWFFLQAMFLPAFVLAIANAAIYARLTRANMLETLNEDYIRTARAKGLRERRVVVKHALRAALTPLVTIAGLDIGALLGGAIITEKVFNIQGLGFLIVDAVNNLDFPVITAVTLLAAAFIVFLNLIVDLLYGVIDPKVRLS
ncbi:ABC transporter permease [Fodinicola feengrottensis]|uniref:ABC transporter permease n=2 Tax=Fodinicola feengrottensis TaxID=435914 RepID=A0ABN2ISS7_9ACTN